MACILVLLDIREGLASEFCLNRKYGDVNQILDYEEIPFHCHRFHSADHLVEQCDHPFTGKWQTVCRKERTREEVISSKKAKGSYTGYGPPIPSSTQAHAEARLFPSSIQFSVAPGSGIEGEGLDTGRWSSEPSDSTMPTSAMDFSFPSPFSSIFLEDPVITMNDIIPSQNPSLPTRMSHPRKVSCFIPLLNNVILEPLVASSTSESLSSKDSRILYALRIKLVLLDSPSGLGDFIGKERGQGGGLAGRGRGKRFHMDIEKEKALFDCVVGTQLTIQMVLRESNPRTEGA